MTVKTFNTLPSDKDGFWQVVVLPTIAILQNKMEEESYTAVSCEWLFWSMTIIIK